MHAGNIVLGDERAAGVDKEGLPAPYIPLGDPTPWDYPYPPPPFIDGHTLDWDNTPYEDDPVYERIDRIDSAPPLPAQDFVYIREGKTLIHDTLPYWKTAPSTISHLFSRIYFVLHLALPLGIETKHVIFIFLFDNF
jgi:hypothetical protein